MTSMVIWISLQVAMKNGYYTKAFNITYFDLLPLKKIFPVFFLL